LKRPNREAAAIILGVAGSASPDDVVANAMAVGMLASYDPRRFTADLTVSYAMANRVRRLDPNTSGKSWDPRSQARR